MPSPIGHALAGLAIAWVLEKRDAGLVGQVSQAGQVSPVEPVGSMDQIGPVRLARQAGRHAGRLALVCMGLAVAPDLDLVYLPIHRTATHSLFAIVIVLIIAAGVTGKVTGKIQWRTAAICALAYGSHILLDWLGADASRPYGIQALWPFSAEWFISPWTIFPGTERRALFSARTILINLTAVVAELGIMGAVALLAWRFRGRRQVSANPDAA